MKTVLLFAAALLLAVVAVPQVEAASQPRHREGLRKHHHAKQLTAGHCRHGRGRCHHVLGGRRK